MGIFPAKLPVTDKTITEGSSENLIFGHCEMQGWRMSMVITSLIIGRCINLLPQL